LSAAGNALGFAQKIVYYSKETIGYLLAKANVENEALVKLSSVETKVSAESKEEGKEEKSEEAVTPVEVPTETSGEKAPEDDKKTDTQLNNPEENA